MDAPLRMTLPKVAYFTMELAVDQSLHTYVGGLGFLAGSQVRSAHHLELPLVGVSLLWKYGYGDQALHGAGAQQTMEVTQTARQYDFLTDTGLVADVNLFGQIVKVKAYRLESETFGTSPVYFLSTDLPENPEDVRRLTDHLYDGDRRTRVAQQVILGKGGVRILALAGEAIDIYHLNEGHALPAVFELINKAGGDIDAVREKTVFTTHTPLAAGNESHPVDLLLEAGFFGTLSREKAVALAGENFSLTVAALRLSRTANAVSRLHNRVANQMWEWVEDRCPIVGITNSVNLRYWQDRRIREAATDKQLLAVKRTLKEELFEHVAQVTGKQLDPDVLTLVWARRFTQHKRPGLLFLDPPRLERLLQAKKLQVLYAGKFHPDDTWARNSINALLALSNQWTGMAVLPGYELELSRLLKRGADVWLNTPLRPSEASGTSGMAAAMNGALHFSTLDGWAVEGTFHGNNGFLINEAGAREYLPVEDRDRQDHAAMVTVLEEEILPLYYQHPAQWAHMMRRAIQTMEAYFHSDRMAMEYFNRLYLPVTL